MTKRQSFFFLWKCVCGIEASLLLLPVLMGRREGGKEGKVNWGQSVSTLESCLLWRGRLLVLQQLLGNMERNTWERNWSIPVNNSRINNYFTAVLSRAARVSQLCISHAPWPQPQELLSRVWGFFGLGNQASLMKQFVEGAVQKAHPHNHGGCTSSLCREGQGCEHGQDAVSPCSPPAGWAVPALSCLETEERAPPFTTGVWSEPPTGSALGRELWRRSLGWAFILPSTDARSPLIP